MSPTRKRMAAAQAALSVALLLVVYLTLLRPDSGDELPRGVNAEQGTELEVEGSFPRSPGERERGPAAVPAAGGSLGEEPLGEVPPGTVTARAPAGPETASGNQGGRSTEPRRPGVGPGVADLDEDPTDDQYEDEVSELLGRVRASGLTGD